MIIHLIRSADLDPLQFTAIYDLIRQYPGPVQYVIHEKPAEYLMDDVEVEIWEEERIKSKNMPDFCGCPPRYQSRSVSFLSWNHIFDYCDQSRVEYQIPANEPVVLLTKHANEHNWFSAADPGGKLNLFVHTDMWDRYISDDFRYPVVYELAAIPLHLLMFDNFKGLVEYAHREPRGCMNDLCMDKIHIRLKLRTGDICPDCRQRIQDRNIDPQVVDQVFRIFEGIRTQMLFRSPVTGNARPSRLQIRHDTRQILLTDLGNLEIRLNPMEKTVFHFFINHTDGLTFSTLPDHKDELRRLYRHYSDTPSIATVIARIDDLCTNRNDGLSQVISRIRRKFSEALPEEMAAQYIIGGEAGRKRRILIERGLVSVAN